MGAPAPRNSPGPLAGLQAGWAAPAGKSVQIYDHVGPSRRWQHVAGGSRLEQSSSRRRSREAAGATNWVEVEQPRVPLPRFDKNSFHIWRPDSRLIDWRVQVQSYFTMKALKHVARGRTALHVYDLSRDPLWPYQVRIVVDSVERKKKRRCVSLFGRGVHACWKVRTKPRLDGLAY